MASKSPSKFEETFKQLSSTIRNKPLATFRFLFFLTIWTLSLVNALIVSREFDNSLPFVISSTSRRRLGIEDPRRQALPVIMAASIVLVVVIPIVVGLPAFGIARFLTRYVIEALWSSSVSLLLLGGAAALAPQPASPLLPRTLQKDLAVILAISFIIMALLTIYNVLMLLRITFLSGKGTQNVMKATVFSLMPAEEIQSESMTEKQPETEAGNISQLENVSVKSGWDDEENAKKTKIEQRFAKAKSILTSPLKQAHVRP